MDLPRTRRNGPSRTGTPLRGPLHIRLTEELALAVKAAAKRLDLTDSAYVRAVLAEHLNMNEAVHCQPVRRYGGNIPVDVLVLNNLYGAIRQQGGLLIQEAKAARESASPHHPALEALILEMDAAAKAVMAMQTIVTGQSPPSDIPV